MDPKTEPVKTIPIPAAPNIVSAPGVQREHEVPVSLIRPSEPELPAVGLQEFGVEVINQHQPNLTAEHQRVGIAPAPVITPIPTQVSELLILTPAERQQAKKVSIIESIKWLWKLVVKNETKPKQVLEGGIA